VAIHYEMYLVRLLDAGENLGRELTRADGLELVERVLARMRDPFISDVNDAVKQLHAAFYYMAPGGGRPVGDGEVRSREFLLGIAYSLGGLRSQRAAAHFGVPHLP
jgi:hypothetical protein